MPQDNAATRTGAAEGEERQPLTSEEVEAIKQEGYTARLNQLKSIKVDRSEMEGDPAPSVDEEDEEVVRQRIIAEAETDDQRDGEGASTGKDGANPASPATGDSAAQIKATQDDEILIDINNASRVKFRTKVDGKEEVVSGEKVLRSFQKDAAADVRLAQATEARRVAEEKLAEAQKRLAEADSAKERKAAEAAVTSSKEKLAGVIKEAMDALYQGEQDKAAQLMTSGFTDVLTATLTSRGEKDPATSSVDVDQVAQQVEQRIEQKGALKKLFADYPEIKDDPAFAYAADMARANFEAEGHSREAAIALAGEAVGQKYGLGRFKTGKSGDATDTTLDGKRAAKKNGTDDVPRAGSFTPDGSKPQVRTQSAVIASMGAQRRGVQPTR